MSIVYSITVNIVYSVTGEHWVKGHCEHCVQYHCEHCVQCHSADCVQGYCVHCICSVMVNFFFFFLKYTEGGLLGGRHGGGGDANSFGEWRQQFRNGERCVPCQCAQSTLYIVYNATLNIVYGVTVYIAPVCTVHYDVLHLVGGPELGVLLVEPVHAALQLLHLSCYEEMYSIREQHLKICIFLPYVCHQNKYCNYLCKNEKCYTN